jgi:hypothetical protein
MQTIISIINRKTNLQVCSAIIDLSNIDDSYLSPVGIFDFIWEDSLKNGMLGDRNDYHIHLFNQRNHTIHLHEFQGITHTKNYSKSGGNVICLQDYRRNHKVRNYAG